MDTHIWGETGAVSMMLTLNGGTVSNKYNILLSNPRHKWKAYLLGLFGCQVYWAGLERKDIRPSLPPLQIESLKLKFMYPPPTKISRKSKIRER